MDLSNPTEAPRSLRILGRLANGAMSRGLLPRRIHPERLLAEARRQTGLNDLGADDWQESLKVLVSSLENDANLSVIGRHAARNTIRGAFRNRLLFQQAKERQPDALTQPIRRPIVIAAMPRTGTTFLQRLMSAHPDALYLPMWLAMTPMPAASLAEWKGGGSAQRVARAQQTSTWAARLNPGLQRKHDNGPREAVECSFLMMSTFQAVQWWAVWPTHSYVEWLSERDPMPVHEMWRDHLALLQAPLPGSHWVLKSPGHFIQLDAVQQTLPNALVVQLHRDPARVLPSTHSLFASAHGLMSREPEMARVVQTNTRMLASASERVVALRNVSSDGFLDVSYPELVADPLGVLRRIYDAANCRWDAEVEQALTERMTALRAKSSGGHRYTAEQFGQTAQELRDQFSTYIDRFDIAPETKR